MADPDAAIDLLAKKEPLINKAIEKQRLAYVTKTLIATPEAVELGIGDIKDARMSEAIDGHRCCVRAAGQAGAGRRIQPLIPAPEERTRLRQGRQLKALAR